MLCEAGAHVFLTFRTGRLLIAMNPLSIHQSVGKGVLPASRAIRQTCPAPDSIFGVGGEASLAALGGILPPPFSITLWAVINRIQTPHRSIGWLRR